ncbi:hypothetical protein DL764_002984 [Monosporascus ibericus]|uniref:Uncharacterized protein n=1 Tax=Monosporascus ibericus TaxID=155417 RepID=A0A4Q4TK47_9PEZI|nr:hypothetical protein DL764_002984 [Monosporascus ibericus]
MSLEVDVVRVAEVSIHPSRYGYDLGLGPESPAEGMENAGYCLRTEEGGYSLMHWKRRRVYGQELPNGSTPVDTRKQGLHCHRGFDEETYAMTATITNGIGQAMPRAAKKGKPKHKESDEEESLEIQASFKSSEDLSELATALVILGCVVGTAALAIVIALVIKCSGAGSPLGRRARDESSP